MVNHPFNRLNNKSSLILKWKIFLVSRGSYVWNFHRYQGHYDSIIQRAKYFLATAVNVQVQTWLWRMFHWQCYLAEPSVKYHSAVSLQSSLFVNSWRLSVTRATLTDGKWLTLCPTSYSPVYFCYILKTVSFTLWVPNDAILV